MNVKVQFKRALIAILICHFASGCFFFRKKPTGKKKNDVVQAVLGEPLGNKAAGPDYEALEEIYALSTEHPPAAIRPDPDTFIRNLLLQYRKEGVVVAQQIGNVEAYRSLLGGASEDFAKDPQKDYDSTSLLANYAVAEKICIALVDPSGSKHPGWKSILPYKVSKVRANITWLAQRFLGIKSDAIEDEVIDGLVEIFDIANGSGSPSLDDYVPVCTALATDADALLL